MDEFKVELKIPRKRVADLLTCALEGGSNYWCRIEKKSPPERFEFHCWEKRPDEEKQEVFPHIDYPMNPGGYLIVSDYFGVDGDEKSMVRRTLDLAACYLGLQKMVEKYPRHFCNFMNDDEDAETGDVFLQCCVLGELVYG